MTKVLTLDKVFTLAVTLTTISFASYIMVVGITNLVIGIAIIYVALACFYVGYKYGSWRAIS